MHDPVIIQQDSQYHVFCTGRGISEWVSKDLQNWTKQKPVFDTLPWAVEAVQGFKNHVWAPDISLYKGKYYLYYSISIFGKNTSCIGVANNTTLNHNDANYRWQDAGKLICSQQGKDNFNAIDPNLVIDANGKPWLSFGSFWSGIQLVQLNDDALGVKQPQEIINIAKRDKATNGNTALEAPFIYFKNGLYYLFVSADVCCKGAESTYKILVGRSKEITGPYLDKEGKPMLNGGGTLVQQGDGVNYYAVGHNAVAVLDGKEFIVYHGYDVNDKGKSKLAIKELLWDNEGWPIVKESINAMKKIKLFVCLQLITVLSFAQSSITVSSPDKRIEVSCNVASMLYSISFNKEVVLKDSKLGVVREDGNFSTGLKLIKSSPLIVIKDNYTILTAKKKNITYIANKKVIETITSSGKKMNIIFQVSNDGVAFKYEFPEQDKSIKKITEETTSFRFLDGTKAWLQEKTEAQSGWEHSNPSYEAHYQMEIATGTPSPTKNGWVYPALFKYNDVWVLLSEAALGRTYCGTALKQNSPDNEYSIGFPQPAETMKGKALNPESTLPWQTPWRIIAIGSLKTIMESTLGTDLAFPAKKMDNSFIKPGKASWSWIMKKDDSTVYRVQKNYVDFAAEMKWNYCLLDANWDTLMGYDSVSILADYAKQKNVGLLLWYNSAGDWNTVKYHPKDKLLTHEKRLKEFARLQSMGIKGVKIDFFGGDGQSFINYYQDILEDAATYHLLVNFHGATLPRGWQRTYPNLMTTEAVYGFEMITFNQKDADLEPQHGIMAAMVRNVFDPMDFTPVNFAGISKRIKRATTQGFELATAVAYLSGIQHYAERPESLEKISPSLKEIFSNIPSVWEEVKFIDGYPGKLFVIARRAGNKWYVAGLNGETVSKELELDLNFISNQITGTILNDNPSSLNNLSASRIDIVPSTKNKISVQPNGGFLWFFKQRIK